MLCLSTLAQVPCMVCAVNGAHGVETMNKEFGLHAYKNDLVLEI